MIPPRLVRFNGAKILRRNQLGLQLRAFSGSTVLRLDLPRSTLSTTWAPTGGMTAKEAEFGHEKLIRAGFLRQAHSGVFQLLPLGLRVQDKIEKLIDKHMHSVGASRLSLSTISSEDLWRKSGRLDLVSSELFRLADRKEVPLILSPTHEEEITTLVAGTLRSYKDLPIRVYQITRKYRDERRPRHGLLRSREFLMKDLYTFDLTVSAAIETYREVSAAYRAFFRELKLPFLVAEASSGDMGGDLSHEYHLPSAVGEDTVVNCGSCGYTANDEVAAARTPSATKDAVTSTSQVHVWRGVSQDRNTLINAWYPRVDVAQSDSGPNLHAIKSAVPELDTSIDAPLPFWGEALASGNAKVINVIDTRIAPAFDSLREELLLLPDGLKSHDVEHSFLGNAEADQGLNLVRIADGDGCPKCEEGILEIHRALEVGHTFHLGTRYSTPLDACVMLPRAELPEAASEGLVPGSRHPVQMGCHGVGVSRIFGAVAEILGDEKGLNWPRAIAPFEVAIIPMPGVEQDSVNLYDILAGRNGSGSSLDVVLDDRKVSFGWKMTDADMVGYPVLVIMGRSWKKEGTCEVQCRRLSIKENVTLEALPQFVAGLLDQL
ncbi:hypothetical protein EDB81DRAFT_802671 [Dactylonectria macrodidyma]|uniref:proline--tRNA ligase n=1 Tax=Dactylonectria macrodidyma TaxID=307937 RepID=A0A9P9EEW7_9HYPO|nr:hypothetical protein EDB81DRAFT_802671 [Dactylonectria macrodidyma]